MGTSGILFFGFQKVIADSVETVAGAQGFDGLITIGGCDKNMPGCFMAIFLNLENFFSFKNLKIIPGQTILFS